jgi:hypothetical protein
MLNESEGGAPEILAAMPEGAVNAGNGPAGQLKATLLVPALPPPALPALPAVPGLPAAPGLPALPALAGLPAPPTSPPLPPVLAPATAMLPLAPATFELPPPACAAGAPALPAAPPLFTEPGFGSLLELQATDSSQTHAQAKHRFIKILRRARMELSKTERSSFLRNWNESAK